MNFCPNCGTPYEENAKFCMNCGARRELPAAAPQPVYAAPPKKSSAKWIILGIVGGLLLLAGLAAAVYFLFLRNITPADDPNAGLYTAYKAEQDGVETDVNALFDDEFTIELKPGGVCTVHISGADGSGKWSLEGNRLTIDDGQSTLTGTLSEGILLLEDVMDMNLYFAKDGFQPPAEQAVESPNTVQAAWWDGDWYGWWTMSACDGNYADMDDQWWDCIATITMDEDGQGHVLLWDEDLPRDNPLAEFDLTVTAKKDGDIGVAACEDGYFLDMPLSGDEFKIDPSSIIYDNFISFDGWYEDDGGSFYFELYMRPWGQLWDDWVADEDDSVLPYYYTEHYLPAIASGQTPPENITEAWGEPTTEA